MNNMDKGAHFFQCDFQVHTPRDAGWDGERATSPAERTQYAEELVRACRDKELNAIAITDHHDFAFFPFVKAAAESEVDFRGDPLPVERRLVVFPGLELTLSSPPCQVILLLDADIDTSKLDDVLTILGLEVVPDSQSHLPTIESLSPASVTGLNGLEDKLNEHKWLRGRFIILPNVTDGGHKSLLREGFQKHYQEMRCVGGYVDGSYAEKQSAGKRNILEGRQQNNGWKPIGVFQTSDNRRRDHADLGKHRTWVKWSEPTAEALRQACLARESRVYKIEPELPSLWVQSMKVSNSKFLGGIDVDLNRQYNALIGGRGTGKSTILEYLRWAFCDQPTEITDPEIGSVQGRRKKLIADTLEKLDGEVIVTFFVNTVRHILKRNAKTQTILLRIGDDEFKPTTEHDVRNLFPMQAYSQKQLSSVGIRIEELGRFVELPIQKALDTIKSELKDTDAKLRSAYANVIRKKQVEGELAKYETETDSLTKQVASLRKALKGLSAADQAVIGQKPRYDAEAAYIAELQAEVAHAREIIESAEQDLSAAADGSTEGSFENVELLNAIRLKYQERARAVQEGIGAVSALLTPAALKDFTDAVDKWERQKAAFDRQYESAKANATANQQQLTQIQQAEKRMAELNTLQASNRKTLKSLGDPEKIYGTLRTNWTSLHVRRLQALRDQCKTFSALSNGLIRAGIEKSLDTEAVKSGFREAFSGQGIKDAKLEKLTDYLLEAPDPITAWDAVLAELELLATHNAPESQPLPDTPILDKCSFITSEKRRLASNFDEARWLTLSLRELRFNPVFEYCSSKDTQEYIPFADSSAGQQATALLTVLLNQPGGPLVIDQPEDDVDSKMSAEIVKQVWQAKNRRQLIFASHNANLVVNGDAELVICCDYKKTGNHTSGRVSHSGAIDNVAIKDVITSVTEGGKEAFKLRNAKYGF